VLNQLAEFIWTETNGNPSEISVLKVIDYLEAKQRQFDQDSINENIQMIPPQITCPMNGNIPFQNSTQICMNDCPYSFPHDLNSGTVLKKQDSGRIEEEY